MGSYAKKQELFGVEKPLGVMSSTLTEIDVTEGLRTFVLGDDEEYNPTPRPRSPVTFITTFIATLPEESRIDHDQQLDQLSNAPSPTSPRPTLKRNAVTAPPGALPFCSRNKPQPPRRAISARTERNDQETGSGFQRRKGTLASPRVSQLGTPILRSLLSRNKTNRKCVGKMGLKPKTRVWRMAPQPQKFQLKSEALSERKEASLEKNRVKGTTSEHHLQILSTSFVDFQSTDLPGTPTSMVATPRELYGTAHDKAVAISKEGPILPVSYSRANQSSQPMTPCTQRGLAFKRNVASANVVSNRRTVYIPGPIRLEEKPIVIPRKGSIATMEPFNDGKEPMGKRFSDMVALDAVVMFFEGLRVVPESTEEGLDRYWVPDARANRQIIDSAMGLPRSAPRPPMLLSPSLRSALFPTMKALQQDQKQSSPSPSTPGRKKGGFRQLLRSGRFMM